MRLLYHLAHVENTPSYIHDSLGKWLCYYFSGFTIGTLHQRWLYPFPDRSIINEADWCECCIAHDIAYWKDGTREERLEADQALKSCVEAKTGNPELAKLMYEGVRAGGSPYFYNWYHWGHGWGYQGEYRELSLADEAQALLLLTDFRSDDYEKICPSN